jgi:hypothetical protein
MVFVGVVYLSLSSASRDPGANALTAGSGVVLTSGIVGLALSSRRLRQKKKERSRLEREMTALRHEAEPPPLNKLSPR